MTLPALNDPRVPWRARMLRKTAAARAGQRRIDEQDELDRVEQLRANVERERIAHELRYRHNIEARAHEPATTRAQQVEELLSIGMDPAAIVAHLAIKAGSIVRALERAERRDLVPPFEKLRRQDRKVPCPMCGRVLVHQDSTGCRPCANAARSTGRRAS